MLDPRSQEFYRRALREHPDGPGALGFDLDVSQTVRFDLLRRCLADLGIAQWDRYSLLDVGCGTGDLLAALQSEDGGSQCPSTYVGLDLMPEMIERAESRCFSLGERGTVEFSTRDVVDLYGDGATTAASGPYFDVSVALATFCLKPDWDDQAESMRSIQRAVLAMVKATRRLVLVTCLSTWKTNIIGEEMVVDPALLWGWARSIWPRVDLIHSYAPHDFALAIWLEKGEWWQAWEEQ